MRISYEGNYDKAVESGLIVSLEEISFIRNVGFCFKFT